MPWKDIDRAIFNLFNEKLSFEAESNGKLQKVPVIFASGERFALTRRKNPIRDKNNALILPLISILRNEIDIRSLKENISLALPRCKGKKELLFYPWDETTLTKDSEGILSPDNSFPLSHKQISMIFVPCLSVDKNLIRLGYGGGYFDKLRTDNNWRNVPCIGVLTSNCVSAIPLTRAEWDIPLSGFITEKEIFV